MLIYINISCVVFRFVFFSFIITQREKQSFKLEIIGVKNSTHDQVMVGVHKKWLK